MGRGLNEDACSEKWIHGQEIFAYSHGNSGFKMYPIVSLEHHVMYESKHRLGVRKTI